MSELTEKRKRGRPPKPREVLRRDVAGRELVNLDVWRMVESKLKGLSGRRSVSRACELIAKEARERRETAPKLVREMLDRHHKHLLNADTLRRHYADAEATRKRESSVATYLERELARLGPWQPPKGT
ncbi:hypothetical protein AC629_34960 [Bradyrhizobium sp. NAS80.1]|uniref:hypothetical protein n=1 Tax=Bradyrhizobium sp. NAS80.1 TaxID=1680159 RepID=UPI000964DDE1|nr:hypothetical protein [Bradyrhizobium sp. NAS80.1]OKO74510.1 hypothetical protein AC629_34960 [Bradyrhizobium sp. NAS80.1]